MIVLTITNASSFVGTWLLVPSNRMVVKQTINTKKRIVPLLKGTSFR